MKMYSMMSMSMSMIMLIVSMIMLNNNMFIMMNIPLLNLMSTTMSIEIIIDWMSTMFTSTVLFISSMIIMFSIYYIPQKEQKQFLILLTMFILSMNILIFSNNILLILLGWDGLGLSSYILVIYYQNFQTAASGSITLLSNRIGDILILLSISTLFMMKTWSFSMNEHFNFMILIMLILAASSKSAQFPFSAWLPMAMAAPTPISALVHSSTLVTAGVYMMIRTMNNNHPYSMLLLMMISSSTAIYASISANWEQDLKKIIALSTLSQIAMMMFAISINSYIMAFSHLIIHAMFKSSMFLCAGVMIHESSYQDMRMMGFNTSTIPLTSSILGITSMSLMGIPFMSGFFSKDMIIEKMISSKLECFLSILMISSIGMTMMYSTRMSFMSNKFIIKSKPFLTNHHSNMYNIPLFILSLMIIISGTSMIWILSPEQFLMIPPSFKYIILIILFMSFMMTSLLSFKSKKYLSMGISSISLWFNHFMSSNIPTKTNPLSNLFMKNDPSWKEMYGPQTSYYSTMKLSKIPNNIYSISMATLILLTIPIMMWMT